MKFFLLSLMTTFSLSAAVFACNEYEELPLSKEIAAEQVVRLAHGIKNKDNQDLIYVACTEMNGDECSKKTFVLDSSACAENSTRKFYEINSRLNLINFARSKIKNRIKNGVNHDLLLPVDFELYIIMTEAAVLAGSSESPIFFLLLPFALTLDLVKAPFLAVRDTTLVTTRRVIMHKMNAGLKERKAGKTNFKTIKDEHFRTALKQLGKAWHTPQ